MYRLDGRTALVTGAGPNIGQAIAKTLALAGARVICNEISEERAAAAVFAVEKAGGKAVPAVADLTKPEQVTRMVDELTEKVGVIDIHVNNAALSIPRSFLNMTFEEWRKVMSIVLDGNFLVTQAVVRKMVEAGKPGVIINMCSTSGHRGRKNVIGYTTAKSGILNYTRSLAVELAPYKIRVCSVSPTKSGPSLGAGGSAVGRDFSEIPLGRLGDPQDQANAVLFLVSDQAAFITGTDLLVDGGTLATWGTSSNPDPTAKK